MMRTDVVRLLVLEALKARAKLAPAPQDEAAAS
jgi:hypothetical protein